MGYLVFNDIEQAQAVNNQIIANMLASESERVTGSGLLSISVNGNLRAEAIKTTQWAEVIELTNNRFAIPAPPEKYMDGINEPIVALEQDDFPQAENPFDL
jgi:hypothetical protein